MMNCKLCPTPMSTRKIISVSDHSPLHNPTMYHSNVGVLQYSTHTRTDIAFAINRLTQFLAAPTDEHWKLLKCMFRYLQGTLHLGLHIQCNERVNLTAFFMLVGCHALMTVSQLLVIVFLGEILASCFSKNQNVVARSSKEAEYYALAHVTAEITWMQSLFKEITIPPTCASVTLCGMCFSYFV